MKSNSEVHHNNFYPAPMWGGHSFGNPSTTPSTALRASANLGCGKTGQAFSVAMTPHKILSFRTAPAVAGPSLR
ncbi:MAG TPA: hypothetical protein VIJ93_09270, partial [bacterium]